MRNPKFSGVFSKASGAGKQNRSRKQLYFVWEADKNNYIVQELNEALIPKSRPELISPSRLQTGFRLEPGILAAPISVPDFQFLLKEQKKQKPTELTDEALQALEKSRKIRQIEEDLRTNFNKALRALNRPRDRKGAMIALENILETKSGIVPLHKHMFRDFGVSLRKKSLPELALRSAQRVIELSPEDDHAHFNIARIFAILGLYNEADAHISRALKLDSTQKIYHKLQNYIETLRLDNS